MDFIKLKKFSSGAIEEMKMQATLWEKIFLIYTSYKNVIPSIYKGFL